MIDVVSIVVVLAIAGWAVSTQQDDAESMDRHTIFCLGLCAHGQVATQSDPNDPNEVLHDSL